MHIGEAASITGLPAKTIRFYEGIGLVEPAARLENGYRDYGARDIHILQFLHRARSLGFSVEDCRELLSLYKDEKRSSADVKRLALKRVDQIDAKIRELESMKLALLHMADECHGDHRPDCPILDDLAGQLD